MKPIFIFALIIVCDDKKCLSLDLPQKEDW